jgi:hypothetical protein
MQATSHRFVTCGDARTYTLAGNATITLESTKTGVYFTYKKIAARMVRHRLRKDRAVAYSLVVEAWSAHQPDGWTEDQPIDVMPRHRPDRKEVVIAFATDGQHIEWKSWATKRDWTERVTALEEEPFEPGRTESWMTQLLK